MANTSLTGSTGTAASALGAGGGTSTAGLADWSAPYITNYLGKAQALSETPYQTYQGPLTAGESGLQTQAFQGIGALTVPGAISTAGTTAGNVANSAGAMSYKPTSFTSGFNAPQGYTSVGGSFADSGVAGQYMNPYLQQALDPQMKELQRQADIQRVQDAGRLTQAGAFGGSRQAIMESEGRRNLLGKQSEVLGQGYASAFDKAMAQYNAEQARKIQEAQFGLQQGMTAADLSARYGMDAAKAAEQSKQFGSSFGLDALRQQLAAAQTQGQLGQSQAEQERAMLAQQLGAGTAQRGITSEGIAADLGEFNAQRDFPYKQVQFQRDMIAGLPTGSVTNTPAQLSGIAQLISSVGGIDKLLQSTGQGDLGSLLNNLGLNFGSSGVDLP
jgi:hypothetical protein